MAADSRLTFCGGASSPGNSDDAAQMRLQARDALVAGIPGMLRSDATHKPGCQCRPLRLLLKPLRPLVQPKQELKDACMQCETMQSLLEHGTQLI